MQQDIRPPLKPRIVLGIGAHPDDLDFGASGTMAAFARGGADVYYLIVTDGGKGSSDPDMTTESLRTIRESEQRKAAKIVGAQDAIFLGYPDGELEVTMELKKTIVKVIRKLKPDVVITMDPSMIYSAQRGFINHPDHRAAGQAALDAVFPLSRDRLSFPELTNEGLGPHTVEHVLLNHFENADFFVDITDTFDVKLSALKAHATQVTNPEATEKWLRQTARAAGEKAGCKLAEGFIRLDLRP